MSPSQGTVNVRHSAVDDVPSCAITAHYCSLLLLKKSLLVVNKRVAFSQTRSTHSFLSILYIY